MTDFAWNFHRIDFSDVGDFKKVAKRIHYEVTGSSDSAAFSGVFSGVYNCAPPGENFVDWADLTPSIVKRWIPSDVIAAAEADVEAQISAKAAAAANGVGAGVPWS